MSNLPMVKGLLPSKVYLRVPRGQTDRDNLEPSIDVAGEKGGSPSDAYRPIFSFVFLVRISSFVAIVV